MIASDPTIIFKKTSLSFTDFLSVVNDLINGSTSTRALFNSCVKNYSVSGQILDLGGRTPNSSYIKRLNIHKNSVFTFTDLHPCEGVITLDVEQEFNCPSNYYDYILCFHLLEHVYSHVKFSIESYRVLKPGGSIIIAVPFIYEYHPDPRDYWRFTQDSLQRLLIDAGYTIDHIHLLGSGLLSFSLTRIVMYTIPRQLSVVRNTLVVIFFIIGYVFDSLFDLLRSILGRRLISELFPTDILIHCTKPNV